MKLTKAERLERIRQLWAEGYSMSWIANTFDDMTRSCVSGYIHRNGFKSPAIKKIRIIRREKPTGSLIDQKPAFQKQPFFALPRVGYRKKQSPTELPKQTRKTVKTKTKSLDDLADNECHWIVSDGPPFKYCGSKAGVNGYCAHHTAMRNRGGTLKTDRYSQ